MPVFAVRSVGGQVGIVAADGDLARGEGRVALPFELDRKYPSAPTEWGWQFVFPVFTYTSQLSRKR